MPNLNANFRDLFESDYPGRQLIFEKLIQPVFGSKIQYIQTPAPRPISKTDSTKIKGFCIFATLPNEYVFPLHFVDITLADNVQLHKSRVAIQNCVRSLMEDGHSALIFFHYESTSKANWRITFVHCNKNENKTTNPKRYTYLCGKTCFCRTAAERFASLENQLAKETRIQPQFMLDAFNVETVSKEFFDKYRELYADFVEKISGNRYVKENGKWIEKKTGRASPYYKSSFSNDDKAVRDFVKKMMGRLVFLQFLQKKGWLGVPKNDEWGNGDKNFIYNLFINSTENQKKNFLEEVLEPIFFNCLNKERKDSLFDTNIAAIGKVKIPYLNGGLFAKDDLDAKEVKFAASEFQALFEFFNCYNFTIDESDPDEKEIGIDPEMLGKIFENLLEDNKDKGTFYTPKEIVNYMCRESLIAYLETHVSDCDVRSFITEDTITELSEVQKKAIKDKLDSVKICDPAVGSGAFPMGLLNLLVSCYEKLGAVTDENRSTIKRTIVQNNIYGVDIEKGAVDIARLRFWLAIVVDEIEPMPLPNFDYKIMQGNSLIESFTYKQYKDHVDRKNNTYTMQTIDLSKLLQTNNSELFDTTEQPIPMLQKTLTTYYETADSKAKKLILAHIEQIIRSIISDTIRNDDIRNALQNIDLHGNNQFFLWHTWFSDVFNRASDDCTSGFDIVIGNPPYGAKVTEEEKKYYREHFKAAKTENGNKGSTDTFTVFIEKGHDILKTGGNLAFIVPMSVTSSDAMCALHRKIESDCGTIRVSSYSNRPQQIFDAACIRTSILMLNKNSSPLKHLYTTKLIRRSKNHSIQNLIDELEFVDSIKLKTPGRYAKVGTKIEVQILTKCFSHGKKVMSYRNENGTPFYYRTSGGRYWNVITTYATGSSKDKPFYCDFTKLVGLILSSSLFYFYQQIYTNGLDLKQSEIENFPLPDLTILSAERIKLLETLYEKYLADIEKNANVRTSSGSSSYNVSSFKEYKIVKSYNIIKEIDDEVCKLYGLSIEESNYIKSYEIEARMAGAE